MLGIILVVVLLCLIIGAWPSFGFHSYGAYPSGILGLILLVVIVLALTGRIG